MSFVRRPALIAAGALIAAALVVPGGVAQAAPVVIATPLLVPPGTTSSYVADLNASGAAAGYLTVNGVQQAVRWSGLRYTVLPKPAENSSSSAAFINDAGTVAGTLGVDTASNVTVRRWLSDGTTSDCTQQRPNIGIIALNAGGETLNWTIVTIHNFSADVCHADGSSVDTGLQGAFSLADDGRVAGYTATGSITAGTFAFNPVVRAADGTVTQLPVPAGQSGEAYAFGPDGSVVGAIGTWGIASPIPIATFTPQKAVIWRNGALTELGTLGGATSRPLSDQRGVSGTGYVVGTSVTASGETHAFRWKDGQLTDLGTLGGTSSAPSAVNDKGQVVGVSTTASGASHAFLWSGGRMIDLGAPGGTGSAATDINDAGQIVGRVVRSNGTDRAFRWTVRGA